MSASCVTRGTEDHRCLLCMGDFGVDPCPDGWFRFGKVSFGANSPSQSHVPSQLRVRSAIILMTCASTVVAAAMVLLILAMTDRHWVVCTSKKVSNAFVQNTKREGDTTQHLTDDRSSPTRLSCRSHRHQASSRV